jgi:hypothetical protein
LRHPSGTRCRNLIVWRLICATFVGQVLGCGAASTGRLPPDLEARVEKEGILRRAADLTFRYTEAPGSRSTRWEDRRASIVVTPTTILIHKNSKIGLDLTPRTRRDVTIEREGGRVRVRLGHGRAEVLWSFEPPDGDAEGWTRDLRAVVRQRNSAGAP